MILVPFRKHDSPEYVQINPDYVASVTTQSPYQSSPRTVITLHNGQSFAVADSLSEVAQKLICKDGEECES